MQNKNLLKLLVFYTSYVWFTSFSGSILPTHFLEQGLSYDQMILGKFFTFASQFILLIFVTSLSSKIAWRLAPLSYLIFVLLSIKIFNPAQFYIANGLIGFNLFFFFIFYNIAYFENTHKTKTGHGSAIMFSIGPVVGIIAPLTSGYLASININLLWAFAIVSFLICIFLAYRQKQFQISYTIKRALQEIKATRLFIFIEGIWEAMVIGLIPIFTLYFIKEPLPYGAYISYLALVSILANLWLGKFTDKIQKRSVFLYPITIIMSISTFIFYFAINNLYLWIIVSSILQFMLPLFWNLSTSMVVDAHANLRLAIPGRELMLASGRIVGLLITFISLMIEKSPKNIFIFLSLIILLFPTLLFYNTKISKKFRYL